MTLGGGCLAAALLAAFLQKGEGSFLPALLLAVSGVLLVLFAGFERSRAGAQAVVLIALLSAVSCAGRGFIRGPSKRATFLEPDYFDGDRIRPAGGVYDGRDDGSNL